MARPPINLIASIRQRLLNIAQRQNQPFDVILVRYGLERLLFRLSISEHQKRFILKGGLLVSMWVDDAMRVTRDIDFLGHGDDDADQLKETFADILSTDCDDGLTFDTENLTAEAIREEVEYGGTRLKTIAFLGVVRIPITIDIGFGDAVAPNTEILDFPHLLDDGVSTVCAYPMAAVIAEKFQAMVALGLINGRMKDYYDLWTIPQIARIPDEALDAAIAATFARRNTPIPTEAPPGLSNAFFSSPEKLRQWTAYARSIHFDTATFEQVVTGIWLTVGPACQRILARLN